MALRHEMANLLGFDNFANYALAKNIASEPQRVLDFLNRLATESYTVAKKEFAEVVALATDDGIADFGRWDLRYYSERLREQKYQYAESDIKPYFPLDKVLTGYFTILNKLYGLTIESVTPPDTWHPDVRYFKVYDENQVFRGGIFVDFFARENKIGGAWANVARARRKLPDGTVQYPIAHLLTNFAAPSDGQPSLLSEEEVMTVFHEFGHCLHTVLTQIEYREISGMAGIPVDGIEFPSQFMEYFCIQKEIMPYISGHYQTGECLPDHLMQRMTAARQFQSALFMIRQVEYALVDFRLHLEYDPAQGARTEAILKSVQNAVAVVPTPPDANRLTHSFTHIFSSGYAAGYYSYKWAEVLSCDAFLRFEEEGLLNPKVGRDFLHLILEQGGLPNLMDAFVQFRGREPRVEALLHYAGLKSLPDISAKGKMLAPLLFKQNTVVSDEKQAALSPAAQFK
jgi:oligopeptidase A